MSDTVYGWSVEYAKSGRSKCQISGETIAQGAVRIGKEVDSTFKAGDKMTVWHLVEPLFASFQKGSAKKSRISDTSELVGFNSLKPKDQDEIRSLIAEKQAVAAELKEAEKGAKYLECKEGGESKWWSIVVAGNATRVRWGKIGEEDNNLSEKEHKDADAAAKFEAKMVAEKTKKGYVLVNKEGGNTPTAKAEEVPVISAKKAGALRLYPIEPYSI